MQKFASFVFVLILCSTMVFGGSSQLKAQTPLARFVMPTNTTATAVQPTFEVITSFPIDTTSVHWYLESDSVHFYHPTICVMLNRDYQKPDSVWPYMSTPGTGTIINDTTIEFQPDGLGNSQLCEAVLIGLRVIDPSSGDTITIPDTVAQLTFTTLPLPPSFRNLSTIDSNNSVRVNDTVTISFSEKLDSTNGPTGPLVSLVIPKYSISSDSLEENDSTISCSEWLDTHDSTKLHIAPTSPFVPGQMYKVALKLSGLTGDTDQDFKSGFVCQKSWRLNVVAAPTAGLICIPTIQFFPPINHNYRMLNDSIAVFDSNSVGRWINAGDTVTYSAPAQVGGAVFKQWTGSGILAIDTSTVPRFSISEISSQLHNITVTALYGPVAIDTVCVATAGTNNLSHNQDFVTIQSDSQDCSIPTLNDTCSSTTSTNYLLERGKLITLTAFSTSDTIQFDHWVSADTTINGSTNPFIVRRTNSNVCATAYFLGTGHGTPQYHLKVYICNITANDATPISSIATFNSSGAFVQVPTNNNGLLEWDLNTGAPDCSNPVELQINNQAYGLYRVDQVSYSPSHGQNVNPGIRAYGKHTQDLWQNYATNGTYDIPELATYPPTDDNDNGACSSSPTTYVQFDLIKLYNVVTVNIAMDDGSFPDNGNLLVNPTSVNPDGVSVELTSATDPINYYITGDPTTACGYWKNAISWEVIFPKAYPPNLSVNLTALADGCHSFNGWDGFCTNSIVPSPAWTNPISNYAIGNHDATATAVFDKKFYLETISFEQWRPRMTDVTLPQKSPSNPKQDPGGGDPAGGPVWEPFSTSSWAQGEIIFGLWGGTSTTWTQSSPTTIRLTFTKPIDPNNFLGCKLVYITGQYGSTTQGWPFRIGQNAAVDLSDDPTGRTVTLTLTDAQTQKLYAWKGEIFELVVQDDPFQPILDTHGDHLTTCNNTNNDGEYYIETENPDIQWYYTNTHVKKIYTDCPFWTDCDASVFTYWMAHNFQYHGNEVWNANSTAAIDQVDEGNDVNATDIAFTCDRDGDGDGGTNDIDDAGPGTVENELMMDCPHCWNHFIAAGAVNRLDADKYDFLNLFTDDYASCGRSNEMWYADIGTDALRYGSDPTWWGVIEAIKNIAANPAHFIDWYKNYESLPSENWNEANSNWDGLGTLIVQPYAETWASKWENGLLGGVPVSQRHLNCIANYPRAQPMAPDWWGASTDYKNNHWQYDNDPGSRIDIIVTIK